MQDTSSPKPRWVMRTVRALRRLPGEAPVLTHALVYLLALELAVILVAPLFIPDHWYLRLYLSDKAESKTAEFARDGDPFLMWDDVIGWRNRPNSGRGKWAVDRFGARATHAYEVQRERSHRIMFLGNSLTNGGMHVGNDETISAFLEDSTTECLNFATMLYAVDQMYLSYVYHLRQFRPDVVVIGISGEPLTGLGNRYVPFWSRIEANVPLFKPRFELKSDSLTVVSMPGRSDFAALLKQPDLLHTLESSDRYYRNFSMYKHFGILPISSSLWDLTRKFGGAVQLLQSLDAEEMKLFNAILASLRKETSADGARLVVLVLPDQRATFPAIWQRPLPDRYTQIVACLQTQGYEVVDARLALRNSGLRAKALYTQDEMHFTPQGNRLIASELKRDLHNIQADSRARADR